MSSDRPVDVHAHEACRLGVLGDGANPLAKLGAVDDKVEHNQQHQRRDHSQDPHGLDPDPAEAERRVPERRRLGDKRRVPPELLAGEVVKEIRRPDSTYEVGEPGALTLSQRPVSHPLQDESRGATRASARDDPNDDEPDRPSPRRGGRTKDGTHSEQPPEAARHHHLGVGEVDEPEHTVDEGVPEGYRARTGTRWLGRQR